MGQLKNIEAEFEFVTLLTHQVTLLEASTILDQSRRYTIALGSNFQGEDSCYCSLSWKTFPDQLIWNLLIEQNYHFPGEINIERRLSP